MSDKQVDEINLKDLSKKIAQSSGNKNVIKAMKPSVDKTKSDLAAMRKRLDALKAGYAAESVELDESKSLIKDYEKYMSQGNKKDHNAIDYLMSMPKYKRMSRDQMAKAIGDHKRKGIFREEVSEANTYVGQRDKMKIVDRKPHPEGGHIVTLQTRTGKTIKRRLHKGKVTDMNEDLQIDEVLDTPKAMQSYRDKAKYSADRAASSAAAKILRGKDKDGNRADHSPEVKTRDKRAKGLKMVDRNATRKVFKALRKEEVSEGGMKRIATTQSNKAERMASGGKKGLETFKKKPADSRMSNLNKKMNEKYKLHHKTMSAALQHAYDEAEKKGYEVDKDDIDNKVAMGPRKPSSGKTNSYNLGLSKKGKPVKQKLHVQVYNMDNKGYELNMYVS